tara:strand:+ start:21931 stop:24489 length:2559 start_codon:yes stop_codon:yes gene_type:complete
MPVDSLISEQKFSTILETGDTDESFDFEGFNDSVTTPYLHGNVTDVMIARTKFLFKWYTSFNSNKVAVIVSDNSVPYYIASTTVDFVGEGWQVGDRFKFTSGPDLEATITSVSTSTMFFNNVTSTITSNVAVTSGTMIGINLLDAAIINWNFIENSASPNYINPIDGSINSYYVEGLDNGGYQKAFPFTNGNNETWIDVSASTNFNSQFPIRVRNNGLDDAYWQEIVVEHYATILPFYLQGFDNNILNNTLPTNFFENDKSVKYIIKLDARTSVGNANNSKVVENLDTLGDVGFFNEGFNGLPNYFTTSNLVYNNGANDSLVKNGTNSISFTLENDTFQISNDARNKLTFFVAKNIGQLSPNTQMAKQYLLSRFYRGENASTRNGALCISNYQFTQNTANNYTITADINFTQQQSQLIPDDAYYCIAISCIDNSGSAHSNVIVDFAQFDKTTDVSGLVELVNDKVLGRKLFLTNSVINPQNESETYEAFNGMIEDSYNIRFKIATKQTTSADAIVGSRIQDANFQIIARNVASGDEFVTQNYAFDLASSIEVPSTGNNPNSTEQNINLINTRGFKYDSNDILNEVRFQYLDTAKDGFYKSNYFISVGFKLGWQEWVQNNLVSNIFYDTNKPNNNQNERISNYSEEQGFELFPVLNLNVSNKEFTENGQDFPASVTEYNLYLPSGIARTYGDDSIPKGGDQIVDCVIETFKTSDGLSTGGTILTNENMLIKATFSRIDGQDLGYTNYAGCIRIDVQNGGLFSIEELSTLAFRQPFNGILIPETGQTRTKMVITATNVELSCLTDFTKLSSGENYNVSARLWSSDEQPEPPLNDKLMENNLPKLMESGVQKIIE